MKVNGRSRPASILPQKMQHGTACKTGKGGNLHAFFVPELHEEHRLRRLKICFAGHQWNVCSADVSEMTPEHLSFLSIWK